MATTTNCKCKNNNGGTRTYHAANDGDRDEEVEDKSKNIRNNDSSSLRMSINLDVGGMDAILGSLYQETTMRTNTSSSSRSCHNNGGGNPKPYRRRRTTDGMDDDDNISISLDMGGMDAILGSLYKNKDGFHNNNKRSSSRSFHHGEAAASDSKLFSTHRHHRCTKSFHDNDRHQVEPSSSTGKSMQTALKATTATATAVHPRPRFRRATVESISVSSSQAIAESLQDGDNNNKGVQAAAANVNSKDDDPPLEQHTQQEQSTTSKATHPHPRHRRRATIESICSSQNVEQGNGYGGCMKKEDRNNGNKDKSNDNNNRPPPSFRRSTGCTYNHNDHVEDYEKEFHRSSCLHNRNGNNHFHHTDTSQRRVSWCNMHSVSLIDPSKSPDTTKEMLRVHATDFPGLPLEVGDENEEEGKGCRLKKRGKNKFKSSASISAAQLPQSHRHHHHNNMSATRRYNAAPPSSYEEDDQIPEDIQQAYHYDDQANPQDNPQPSSQSSSGNLNLNHNNNHRPKTRVISLPWTDSQGIQGQYSGEVNSSIQPHGQGTFVLNEGGSSIESIWKDGVMVRAMIPLNDARGRTGAATTTSDSSMAASSGHHTSSFRRSSSNGTAYTAQTLSREPSSSSPTLTQDGKEANHNNNDGDDEQEIQISPTPTLKSTVSTTSLPGYHLGHTVKHRSHMQIPPNATVAVQMAYTLQSLDFAFVLRSNGDWTYSIVADRPFSEDGPSIRFVLDGKGSTKTIRKKYWDRGIRLVNGDAVGIGGNVLMDRRELDEGGDGDEAYDDTHDVHENNNDIIECCREKKERNGDSSDKRLWREPSRRSVDQEQAVKGSMRSVGAVISSVEDSSSITSSDANATAMDRRTSTSKKRSFGKKSFTSIKPVNGSFDQESRNGESISTDGTSLDKAPMARKRGDRVDESERSNGTLGSTLQAMLSLDYLGMLDDSISKGSEHHHYPYQKKDQPQQQQQQRRKSTSYHGDVSMRSGASFATEKSSQKQEQQRRRKSTSFYEDASMTSVFEEMWKAKSSRSSKYIHRNEISTKSSSSSFHLPTNHSHRKKGGIVNNSSSSSSFHTSGWDSIAADNNSSNDGMSSRRSSRRGSSSSQFSVSSMGSNVSNLEELLREIYSPEYLERAEERMMQKSSSAHSMATIYPN